MSLAALLTSKGDLKRQYIARDAEKGNTPDYNTLYANVPCDVQDASAQTVREYMQQEMTVNTSIYFDQDLPGITPDDLFVVDGDEYIVRGWHKPLRNRLQVPYQMDCERKF